MENYLVTIFTARRRQISLALAFDMDSVEERPPVAGRNSIIKMLVGT